MNDIEIKFTAWLKVLVKRARVDYFRRKQNLAREVFFDDLGEQDIRYIISNNNPIEFEESFEMFENKDLSEVYEQLTDTQRSVLYRIFVCEQTAAEIAVNTGWSIQHIYNQKYLAVKRIREFFKGENHGRL